MSACDPIIVLNPSRKTGWSSTLRMRIGPGRSIGITPPAVRQLYRITRLRWSWCPRYRAWAVGKWQDHAEGCRRILPEFTPMQWPTPKRLHHLEARGISLEKPSAVKIALRIIRTQSVCRRCSGALFRGSLVQFRQHLLNLRIRHKRLPDQATAIVLDHDDDRRLIQSHVNWRHPIELLIDGIARSVDAPEAIAQIAVVVFERFHRRFGCIAKRRERAGWRKGSGVIIAIGGVRHITVGAVAGSQTPRIWTVPSEVFRIRNRVGAINPRDIAIVLEIRFGETIVQAMRIETHIGVVGKEERPSAAHANVELNSEIAVAVAIAVAFRAARPAGIVKRRWHRMCRRRHAEQIGNHYFVEADERMMDLPRPLRRPMPIQKAARRGLAVPTPVDALPKIGNAAIERLFVLAFAMKILPRGQQAFHKEGSLDQVASVFIHAEHGHRLAIIAIHKMRPRAVVALGVLKKSDDLCQPFHSFLSSDEAPIHSNHQSHDCETARAGGDDAIISGNIFASHPGMRVRALPVVTKAGSLQHGEKFIVGHLVSGCAGRIRKT